MKVNGSDALARLRALLTRAEGQSEENTEASAARRGPSNSGPDKLQLSDRALELGQLRAAIAQNADLRSSLVQELKEQITSGRYQVDGTRVADAMLQELDL